MLNFSLPLRFLFPEDKAKTGGIRAYFIGNIKKLIEKPGIPHGLAAIQNLGKHYANYSVCMQID